MSTCPKNPLGDIFNAIGEPIEISGTITNNALQADIETLLKNSALKLDTLGNTESDKIQRAVLAGEINAYIAMQANRRGIKRPRSGGKRRYKGGTTSESDKRALMVVLIITLLLCDIIYGDDKTKQMREYIIDTSKSLTEPLLKNLNDMFNAVIQSYVKALPGMTSGCTTNLDYSIDVLRDLPFIGRYVSLDNKLPTCAQRMLSFNETVASLRKVGTEVGIGIVALLGATTAGAKYQQNWNETTGTTVDKIAAVCGAITSDTYKLGEGVISSILYLPMASARALSDIVPAAVGGTWTKVTDARTWLQSWSTLNQPRIAIAASADTSGTITADTSTDSSGTIATDNSGAPDYQKVKKQRKNEDNEELSGGRRTRRRKSHNKAAKKSRKQKKKRSSTKHKRRGRKTRRGGMGCGKHKTKRRRRR
jgi:hypothetical protein